ncbi:MAG: DUF1015 domain-containing protein [Anaerolineaceae bacterium]
MRNFPNVGIQIADILLPAQKVDLTKWAVIACDQFTSQPEYWQQVTAQVGDAPSTLHMILPEVYLGTPEEKSRIQTTQKNMQTYLNDGTLVNHEGLIYVERTVDGKTRHGLILALDLEKYDFTAGSQSLIRATEGTIIDRLPPRIKIREGAPLEIPHILVLIDDPKDKIFSAIKKAKSMLPIAYDFELMQKSGHLCGRYINDHNLEELILSGLAELADPTVFQAKYDVGPENGVLLFAMGDGNHSLATAKSIWEKMKQKVGPNHPARYALVEIENVHDEGLEFAPIHRVLFNMKADPTQALHRHFGQNITFVNVKDKNEMIKQVNKAISGEHHFGLVTVNGFQVVTIKNPEFNLPVGTLQAFLDSWLKSGWAGTIDYVHGDDIVCSLGGKRDNAGFYLPGMPKSDLFKTVILDGVLPRKTFSMGEAHEKRFYMESRKIV